MTQHSMPPTRAEKYWKERASEIQAATIERCAQVAKDYGLSRVNDEKDYPATIAAAIAYHIEALKEQP